MSDPKPEPSRSDKLAALVVANMASFLMPFMASSLNIALPTIGTEFSMDAVMLSWVATSYLLVAAMFILPFGERPISMAERGCSPLG